MWMTAIPMPTGPVRCMRGGCARYRPVRMRASRPCSAPPPRHSHTHLAAKNMGDAHVVVVNDVGEVVRWKAIRLEQDLIVDELVSERNVAVDEVANGGRARRNLKTCAAVRLRNRPKGEFTSACHDLCTACPPTRLGRVPRAAAYGACQHVAAWRARRPTETSTVGRRLAGVWRVWPPAGWLPAAQPCKSMGRRARADPRDRRERATS